jgi:hypothetical protein
MSAEPPKRSKELDLRLVLLERAAARLQLVYSGELGLDEAIDGLVEVLDQLRPIKDDAA